MLRRRAEWHGALTCTADLRVGDVPGLDAVLDPADDAARYDFEPEVPFGVPFRPTPFRVTLALSIGGADVVGRAASRVSLQRPVRRREAHGAAGRARVRRPRVAGYRGRSQPGTRRAEPRGRAPGRPARVVEVTVSNNQKGPVTARRRCTRPDGWRATRRPPRELKFERENEDATVKFTVTPPAAAKAGEYAVGAEVDGRARRVVLVGLRGRRISAHPSAACASSRRRPA